jgi:glycine betaine/choline ABC-type transport system substrate-binding protein
MTTTRRKFLITSTAAAAALIATRPAFAQDDAKPTVTVGSKDFTESVVLGEMVAHLLEGNGYSVERELNLGGSVVVHEALVAGAVDVYVEYTGTGLLAILGMELPSTDNAGSPAATPDETVGVDPVYEIVSREYAEQFGLDWLKPWGFNNTYALAMRGNHAAELGVTTISDLVAIAGDLTFGATQEFLVRQDGLPGLEATYDGLEFGDSLGLDPGLMYAALTDGQVDVISAFATDGRVAAFDLTLLEDDLGFFPPYFAAPVVRQDLIAESPEVAHLLNQLAGQIDDATMAGLNLEIDEGGREATDVAREFLVNEGFIAG